MIHDIVINKVETIERCLHRIHEVYQDDPGNLKEYTKQDSIVLNIQRACEASIDLAMHIISEKGLGIPKTSRDGFRILQEAGIVDAPLAKTMMNMVGFRNIAVYDYQSLNLEILQSIVEKHIGDFKAYTKAVLTSLSAE